MAKMSGFAKIGGLALGAALVFAVLPAPAAQASPFGAIAQFGAENALPLADVQYRRPVRRKARRGNSGALTAGALIGAAIIGSAIIANSNRGRRGAYYDEPDHDVRYYQPQPQPYYGRRVYQQRYVDVPTRQVQQRRYQQPRYYEEPRYTQQPPNTYRTRNPAEYRAGPGYVAPSGPPGAIITPRGGAPYFHGGGG